MIKPLHLKSLMEHLNRNRFSTAINIFGFAVSLTFVILIGLYIQEQLRVDERHVHAENIYRLEHNKGVTFSAPIAPGLEARYPEIESVVRIIYFSDGQLYSPLTGQVYQENVWHADSTLFDIFSFDFVEGDPHTALSEWSNVVLTESLARRMFGAEAALGQRVKSYKGATEDMIVSGVIRDFEGMHFKRVEIIHPMSKLRRGDEMFGDNFNSFSSRRLYATYILTKSGTDLSSKSDDMSQYFRELGDPLFTSDASQAVHLTPLGEVYLADERDQTGWFRSSSSVFLIMLGVSAALVLIFAMINYVNLSVAQAGARAKESAIRQLMGEMKGRLIAGFIIESILMCVVSVAIALLFAKIAEPYFQQVMNTEASLAKGLDLGNVLLIIGLVLLVGGTSGMVPGMVIASYKPIDVVRGSLARKTKMTFSKVLISTQYAISIVLIGCTIIIGQQVHYMQTRHLGYQSRCILSMDNPVGMGGQVSLREQLMAIPGVERVSFVRGHPTQGGRAASWALDNGENVSVRQFQGDSAYMSMMNFEILHRTGIEDQEAVWLNETAWSMLGLAPNATELQVNSELKLKLKGRIRDFHFQDYTQPVGPVSVMQMPTLERGYEILVQVSDADLYGVADRVGKLYNQQTGGETFRGTFLDDQIAAQYAGQRRMADIIGALSVVAIVIAALGMLAMATYFTRQREQEVAIRKTFGSTTREVLVLLMGSFLRLVVIAFVVATPLTIYIMQQWLSGYAYRVHLSWVVFAISGIAVSLIAGASVWWHSRRTAHTNPVMVLRK